MEEKLNEQSETEQPEKSRCLNCEKKLPREAVFCPRCGQRNNKGRVSMRELFQRFWNNFSHLDSKFVKICWQLFLPARVTLEYFKGRQKRYPNPVQFLLIVMFFFLFFMNKTFDGKGLRFKGASESTINFSTDSQKEKGATAGDFFTQLERYVATQEIKRELDSLPPEMNTPQTRIALDSLLRRVNGGWAEAVNQINQSADSTQNAPVISPDSLPLSLMDRQIKVAVTDLARLEPQELADHYQVHDWVHRVTLIQGIKSIKNPQSLMHSYLGSMTWTILVLITLMSGILALLYLRQRRFFVEHFVFLLHQHSAGFLVLALALAINLFWKIPIWIWPFVFLGISVHLYFSMRRFYGQGGGKTFLKWLIYNVLYFFGFLSLFIVGILVVFLVF